MKAKLLILAGVCSLFLLTGCSSMYGGGCGGGGCGYYDYPSQCGLDSCTDNTYIVEYSNPCPGTYDCYAQ